MADDTCVVSQFAKQIGRFKRSNDSEYEVCKDKEMSDARNTKTKLKKRKNDQANRTQIKCTDEDSAKPTKLGQSFFNVDCCTLSKELIGCKLVRKLDDGQILAGVIVETEAYLGGEDKAAHSFGNRSTERNRAMFMQPGTAYVYLIYGMHYCFNISSQGDGAAVLIRALQPSCGLNQMRVFRMQKQKKESKVSYNNDQLCSGPAKLCQALAIDKTFNCINLCDNEQLWLEPKSPDDADALDIVNTKRINVEYAGNFWANQLLRFHAKDSRSVSVSTSRAKQRHQIVSK